MNKYILIWLNHVSQRIYVETEKNESTTVHFYISKQKVAVF